jgi:hypothetical protein
MRRRIFALAAAIGLAIALSATVATQAASASEPTKAPTGGATHVSAALRSNELDPHGDDE